MTSTTDMAGHPDVAEISDLTEGLLSPSRTTQVRRHLNMCELCADVHASLEEIRELLGTASGPPRMPAEVAGRIDAALAAEALLSAGAPTTGGSPAPTASPRPASTASPVGDGTRVSRETSATTDRPSGHARTASTGPGRKSSRARGRRKVVALGVACTAAVLTLGSVLLTSLWNNTSSGNTTRGHQSTAADTFSEGKLESQVTTLLAQSTGSSEAPNSLGAETAPGTVKPKIFRQPTVPPCIQQGIGRNDAALATEQGIYQGTDALLVVLPDASDSTRVTVYIVDTTCVSHPSATPAKVLLTHSYTRS
ncbi:anti-sigma factor family protein [Streptomyces sp. NPDC059378]|uniref:anti-sigma factor family protein n=1 Tax=Streptomyces sp. NPDC059378 TaxID=3346815 RepID=UPI0036CB09CB